MWHLKAASEGYNPINAINGIAELIPIIGLLLSQIEKTLAPISFKVIKAGSMNECIGPIDKAHALNVCDILNKEKTTGVRFPKNLLIPGLKDGILLLGGTCSAMSFDFADRYLRLRKTHSSEIAITALGDEFKTSSVVFRTRQAAFNTISKNHHNPSDDFGKAKIQAMLAFHKRKVVEASEHIYLPHSSSVEKIGKILNRFQQGVFVIRSIQEAENQKDEVQGHSTILIRDGEKQYYYDPGKGVSEIESGYEATTLHKFLREHSRIWNIPSARIYKIS